MTEVNVAILGYADFKDIFEIKNIIRATPNFTMIYFTTSEYRLKVSRE